jgi:hypothetical protein
VSLPKLSEAQILRLALANRDLDLAHAQLTIADLRSTVARLEIERALGAGVDLRDVAIGPDGTLTPRRLPIAPPPPTFDEPAPATHDAERLEGLADMPESVPPPAVRSPTTPSPPPPA